MAMLIIASERGQSFFFFSFFFFLFTFSLFSAKCFLEIAWSSCSLLLEVHIFTWLERRKMTSYSITIRLLLRNWNKHHMTSFFSLFIFLFFSSFAIIERERYIHDISHCNHLPTESECNFKIKMLNHKKLKSHQPRYILFYRP